jgi:hypothetical protein
MLKIHERKLLKHYIEEFEAKRFERLIKEE